MPPWATLALIGVAGLVLYAVIRAAASDQRQAGRAAERADRAAGDLKTTTRQGEIIAEQRTVDDAAKRLDSGDF